MCVCVCACVRACVRAFAQRVSSLCPPELPGGVCVWGEGGGGGEDQTEEGGRGGGCWRLVQKEKEGGRVLAGMGDALSAVVVTS